MEQFSTGTAGAAVHPTPPIPDWGWGAIYAVVVVFALIGLVVLIRALRG